MAESSPPPTPIGGDYVAGDKIINQHAQGDLVAGNKIVNQIETLVERALSAAEEAEQQRAFERQRLAQGVSDYARRLQAQATGTAGAASPYRGLLEYRLADATIFLGRERATTELLECLAQGPLTVLHSESGAGKTSLLQAGLMPRLIAAGHLPVYLRPYNAEPGYALKRAFLPDPSLAPELATAPLRDFLRQVTGVLGPGARLYLLLDQFEEFYTRLDAPAQAEFGRELAECLDDPGLSVRWLLALRGEYFSRLAGFRPRVRNPFENDFRLQRLARGEARDVVVRPAEQRGVTFEPGLVETLLDDLAPASAGSAPEGISPPQLQLVCAALFEELKPGEHTITRALYEQEGGVAGILRGHLERVLSRDLPPELRPAARRLLESLISSEQQRLVRTQAELAAELTRRGVTPATLDTLLTQLTDSRLVKASETEAGPAYELAHDYLLREIQLDPQVQAQKAAQELLEQEVRAYRRYRTLLSAERLQLIEPHRLDLRLTPEAEQLLAESREAVQADLREEQLRRMKEIQDAHNLAREMEARRQAEAARAREAEQAAARLRGRNRLISAASALALLAAVLAIALGVRAGQQAQRADANASTAQAASTRAVDEADRSAEAEATAEAERAIAEAERAEAERQQRVAQAGELAAWAEAALSRDPELALLLASEAVSITRRADGSVLPQASAALYRVVADAPFRGVLRSPTNDDLSARFSPDGTQLLTGGDGVTYVWAYVDGPAPLPMASLSGTVSALSPAGNQVLTVGCAERADRSCRLEAAYLWQLPEARLVAEVARRQTFYSAEFSADGQALLTRSCLPDGPCAGPVPEVWDAAGRRLTAPTAGQPAEQSGLGAASDRLATAADGQVSVWDLAGRRLAEFAGQGFAFAPGGDRLAIIQSPGGITGTVEIWQLGATGPGQRLAAVPGMRALFDPSGTRLVTWDDLGLGPLQLWEADTGAPLTTLLTGNVFGWGEIKFSRDGRRLLALSSGGGQGLWLWAADGTLIAELDGPGTVHSLDFDMAGQRVVASGCDGTGVAVNCVQGSAHVWDAQTGALLGVFDRRVGSVTAASFSPDGTRLLTSGCDVPDPEEVCLGRVGTARLWDVDGSLVGVLPDEGPLFGSGFFTPDGTRLLTTVCARPREGCSGNAVQVWQAETGQPLGQLAGGEPPILALAVRDDSRQAATRDAAGRVRVWDLNTYRPVAETRLAYAPSTSRAPLFVPGRDWLVVPEHGQGSTALWDYAAGEVRHYFTGQRPRLNAAGTRLATEDYRIFSTDETALAEDITRLWDTATGEQLASLEGRDAVFSPDGSRLVTLWCGQSGGETAAAVCTEVAAYLWDQDGQAVATLLGHADWIVQAAFSPDGARLVTASVDRTARLWRSDGQLIATLAGHTDSVLGAVFDPSGARLLTLSSDNTARLWDGRSGALLATLAGGTGAMFNASFAPSSQWFVTAGTSPAQLWDAAGNRLMELAGHRRPSSEVAFNHTGARLITIGLEGTVRLWEVYPDVDALLAEAARRVGRTLTAEECQQFLRGPCGE